MTKRIQRADERADASPPGGTVKIGRAMKVLHCTLLSQSQTNGIAGLMLTEERGEGSQSNMKKRGHSK